LSAGISPLSSAVGFAPDDPGTLASSWAYSVTFSGPDGFSGEFSNLAWLISFSALSMTTSRRLSNCKCSKILRKKTEEN
jgi:hypothetical protein